MHLSHKNSRSFYVVDNNFRLLKKIVISIIDLMTDVNIMIS